MSRDPFHDEMAPHRPARPELGEGATGMVRQHANRQYRTDLLQFFAASASRKILGRVGERPGEELETLFNTLDPDSPEWPQMFCAECYAGTYPEFGPYRGLDSEQRCAEDGEDVFWTVPLTPEELWVHRVFNILVDECRASERLRNEFLIHWPGCREFRFQGGLGFGGKVYQQHARTWVSCYSEDRTAERDAMVLVTNAKLARLTAP